MRSVIRYLGLLLIISVVFRILPIIAGLIYGERITPFVVATGITLLFGLGFMLVPHKGEEKTLSLKKGLMLTAFSFIFLPAVGALSYLDVADYSLTDSLFESFSGYTTTGLTIFDSVEELPKHTLLWRAETQWIGGIGIIIVFLFVFAGFGSSSDDIKTETMRARSTQALYRAQGFTEKLEANTRQSITRIASIYFAYTIAGMVLLFAAGLSFFEAVSMSFAAISTGGFSVTSQFFSSTPQLLVLSALMLIGATSFLLHNKLVKLKFKEVVSSIEFKLFFALLLVFSAAAYMVMPDLTVVLFQIISGLTTTGFSNTTITLLPSVFIMVLMISMVIGGSMGSTAGGIKQFRFYMLLKSIPWLIRKLSYPRTAIIPLKVEKKTLPEETLLVVEAFVSLYMLLLVAGTTVFVVLGYSFFDSTFQVISALGTVGLQTISISTVPAIGKYVLIILMLLGRLEIFPVLVLIRGLLTRK